LPGLSGAAALAALFAPVAGRAVLGLAVSGGGDSLALMLLAARWARALATPPRLIVYTLDHRLRPEAAAEAAFVVETAAGLGLAARALRWPGAKPASGVQAAARAARYRLIGAAMQADGAELLLTAHHRDDQAETVLMRLAHGSGLEGLRGMARFADVEGVPVFRPLLEVAPAELRALVEAAGLIPVRDPSNFDRHYERVRWREALPGLAALGLDAARLAQFAGRAGEADAALEQWAANSLAELVAVDALGAAQLPAARFAALPRAVGVKLLSRVLALAGGGQRPRALGPVERLATRLAAGAPLAAVTVLGTRISQRGGTLWFVREAGRGAGSPAVLPPAATLFWDRRFRITNHSSGAFEVRMAREFSRQAAERLVGARIVSPASAIRSAPLVSGAGGEVLALGTYRLSESVAIEMASSA